MTRVYPETWEVDVQPIFGTSGTVRRCKVLGVYLPEVHRDDRQSKVVFGRLDAFQQSPVAVPVHNVIIPDSDKPNFVYWSEHLAYRITVKQVDHPDGARTAELEIRNQKDGKLLQLRILEDEGVIRLDTPKTRIVMNDADGSVLIECDETATIHCKDAVVNVENDLTAEVGNNAEITVSTDATVDVGGNVTLDAGGNVEVTAGGEVNITGSLINLNG